MKLITIIWCFLYSLSTLGSAYHIINDPTEAIAMRMALVASAKKSIYSAKFIFKSDEMGLSTLATLRKRARIIKSKGNKADVKVLLDATGSIGIPVEVLLHLENEGVQVRFYNDIFSLKKSLYNLSRIGTDYFTDRMHDKLLIIDNNHAISGGRNIQDSYYSIGEKNYLDRDIYVSKEAAWTATEHFLDMWYSRAVTSFDFGLGSVKKCYEKLDRWFLLEKISKEEVDQCKVQLALDGEKLLDEVLSKIEQRVEEVNVDIEKAVETINGLDHNKDVSFIGDKIDDDGRYESHLSRKLVEIASKAQKSLLIETPYLIPSERMLKVFKDLLNKGVEIKVVTNSLKSTDGLQAFAAYYKYRKILAQLGDGKNQIKIYEYMGSELGDYLHAKSAVIDDEIALIGSYNLDPRSDKHNTEVLFLANDNESAAELRQSILSHTKHALLIGSNGNPEGGSDAFPGASFKKKAWIKFYRDILRVPVIGPAFEDQL